MNFLYTIQMMRKANGKFFNGVSSSYITINPFSFSNKGRFMGRMNVLLLKGHLAKKLIQTSSIQEPLSLLYWDYFTDDLYNTFIHTNPLSSCRLQKIFKEIYLNLNFGITSCAFSLMLYWNGCQKFQLNLGFVNGLVTLGNKPLPEPMSTDLGCHMASLSHHKFDSDRCNILCQFYP